MKGIEGNFMSQPRVFAHSAVPVSATPARIPGTEERGCALYVGTGGTLVVKMEGTHQTALMPGPSYVAIFTNVPNGSFLPLLVTHVLDDNSSDLEDQVAFGEAAVTAAEEQKAAAQLAVEAAETAREEAVKDKEICLGKGGTDEACDLTYGPAIDAAARALSEAEDELKDAEDALQLAEKQLDIANANLDEGAIATDATGILGLF